MSALLDLRKAIKARLTEGGLWEDKAVIIHRRLNIWNAVATAINASRHGAVVVVGIAQGDGDSNRQPKSRKVIMNLTVPISLVELPKPDPEETEEDLLWEQTVVRLQGDPLGRAEANHDFAFQGFDEEPSEQYVIRQATFRTRVVLTPDNTPS